MRALAVTEASSPGSAGLVVGILHALTAVKVGLTGLVQLGGLLKLALVLLKLAGCLFGAGGIGGRHNELDVGADWGGVGSIRDCG